MVRDAKKHLKTFIEDIPQEKLTGLPEAPRDVFKDKNFKLVTKGVTVLTHFRLLAPADSLLVDDSERQQAVSDRSRCCQCRD